MSETIYSEASFGKCPFFTAQKIFSGKWSVLIVHLLCEGPKRFGQLHRSLETITQTTLAKQLHELEDYGIISRKVFAEIPPRTEYALTEMGEEFRPILDQVEVWGNKYIDNLKKTAK